MWPKLAGKTWFGYCVAILGVAATTGALKALGRQINPTTAALALLLIVLFVATGWGSRPAVLASLLGMLCFNFFFLPPVATFTISDPDNWIAFIAFLITAVTAGQLSARAKRRAEEAEAAKREIERLYYELQDTFERSAEAKALKRSEQLKSALLDAVTHDLRTPLTSIKASVTTLLDEERGRTYDGQTITLDSEVRREMLSVIDEESDRLNRFIESLIEMARLEAGEMQLQRNWSSVDEIVTMALTRAEKLTKRHRINIKIESDLPVARIDSRAVAEVLYTLVDNAVKYSPANSKIIIEVRSVNGDGLQFAVEDEGPGIPPALREKVFDKFFRAVRDSDVGRPSGSGMGLAIAKGIVEAHGGRIWVKERLGDRGAVVVFTLPIGDDE